MLLSLANLFFDNSNATIRHKLTNDDFPNISFTTGGPLCKSKVHKAG